MVREFTCSQHKADAKKINQNYNRKKNKLKNERKKNKTINSNLISALPKDINSRLDLARTVAAGDHPWFEVKKSKILKAGNGLFVSNNIAIVPEGTEIPFCGEIKNYAPPYQRE